MTRSPPTITGDTYSMISAIIPFLLNRKGLGLIFPSPVLYCPVCSETSVRLSSLDFSDLTARSITGKSSWLASITSCFGTTFIGFIWAIKSWLSFIFFLFFYFVNFIIRKDELKSESRLILISTTVDDYSFIVRLSLFRLSDLKTSNQFNLPNNQTQSHKK